MFEFLEVRPNGDLGKVNLLRNKDLIPMGPPRRLWGVFSYAAYWGVNNLCISSWTGASSLLALGLNVGETMGIVVLGNVFIAVVALFNGAPGGYYHIGFTMLQRLIFGMRGSYFGIAMRTILSVVWYASQAWLGGLVLGCVFSSWSKNYLYMENTFPESVHMSSKDLISFVCFQLISIPILCVKPEKIDKFLVPACLLTFCGMLAIVSWAVAHNGGNGPLMSMKTELSSSAHGWAWIYGITSWYGSLSAGITNQSDFTRFSKRTWSCLPGTIFSIVVMGSIVPLMGLITASATKEKYSEEFWQPNQILDLWLQNDYSSKSRAATFFVSLCFISSQLALNCIGNGYAGGMDMAGLFPKYINIRRGAIITSILCWVIQPWLMYNTASTFVVVMSSFSVFMAPIIGIMISEFWIIRKKHIKLSDLYTLDPDGNYWYWNGINWKAIISFFVACAPGLPGLVNGANPSLKINEGATNYYYGNCIFGMAIAMFLNLTISYFYPSKNPYEVDTMDYFDSFTPEECETLGIKPYSEYSEDVHFVHEIMLTKSSQGV